jgi:hypothetical protein
MPTVFLPSPRGRGPPPYGGRVTPEAYEEAAEVRSTGRCKRRAEIPLWIHERSDLHPRPRQSRRTPGSHRPPGQPPPPPRRRPPRRQGLRDRDPERGAPRRIRRGSRRTPPVAALAPPRARRCFSRGTGDCPSFQGRGKLPVFQGRGERRNLLGARGSDTCGSASASTIRYAYPCSARNRCRCAAKSCRSCPEPPPSRSAPGARRPSAAAPARAAAPPPAGSRTCPTPGSRPSPPAGRSRSSPPSTPPAH